MFPAGVFIDLDFGTHDPYVPQSPWPSDRSAEAAVAADAQADPSRPPRMADYRTTSGVILSNLDARIEELQRNVAEHDWADSHTADAEPRICTAAIVRPAQESS